MTTKTGVIYLLKDKFQLYSPFLPSIIEFRFVPEIIRDLDVVNKGLLDNLVKVFANNGKIPPSNLIFVLSDSSYFIKDFTLPAQPAQQKPGAPAPQAQSSVTMENLKQAADQFIEHVPYDNVVSKTFPLKNGLRVCAVNQDFYESFREAFEKLGFTVSMVIPGLVLGNNQSAKPLMDAGMALGTVQRAGMLKQFDLLTQHTFVPDNEKSNEPVDEFEAEEQQSKKPNKKRLIAMIGLLAVLLIILVVVFIQSQTPPAPTQPAAQTLPPVSAVKTASTVNTATATAPTAAQPTAVPTVSLQNLTVQITNSSLASSSAQTLKTNLTKLGFKSVTLQAQTSLGTSTTIVAFSGSVAPQARTQVLDEVKKFKPDISVQERQAAAVDVSIILGN